MKLDGSFLRSKLGRRIFSLFICCSIIPIAALSTLSFNQVMKHLEDQSRRRLQQSTKAFGMSTFERMTLLDTEFIQAGHDYRRNLSLDERREGRVENVGPNARRFNSIWVRNADGSNVVLAGKNGDPIVLTPEEQHSITNGKTAVFTRTGSSPAPHVFLARILDDSETASTVLMAEINTGYLWSTGPDNTLPPMTDMCVLDYEGRALISSITDHAKLDRTLSEKVKPSGSRVFDWEQDGIQYLASYWSVFMRSGFECPNWTVVLCQSKKEIFAPLNDFKLIFSLVTFLSLLIVAFLSMYYIRQTLGPLETLKEGINQISKKDFTTRIRVSSGDEFEEVAATFNEMTAQLGRQFHAISTMSEIDRAILSSLDTDRIIGTALTAMRGFFSCEHISINLLDPQEDNVAYSYLASDGVMRDEGARRLALDRKELQMCLESPDQMVFTGKDEIPRFLTAINGETDVRSWLVLPVLVKNRLAATINMGYFVDAPIPPEDLEHARRLADQMAIALSNSALIEELDQLNWGTLKALARTVDAKSPWTAGHSERVTDLAMRIAQVLGLSREDMDDLHRGAYLHDIGKIGVPNRILDKTGKLTENEYDRIRRHTVIGGRILEPIGAYQRVIPIVAQHHERFDGNGYPDGLAGDAIHLGARILAVADVYDAMVSNRPYRDGLLRSHVIDYIRKAAGEQFDPQVVEAFLEVMTEEDATVLGEEALTNSQACA
ncbi:MAG: HD domain-containing phosphohydrolase [Syntrophobacteraceae bacterium]